MINSNLEPPPVEPEERAPGDPDLDSQLAEAWDRIEDAQDDSAWVEAFLAWLELHRLAYGPENGGSEEI